MEMHSLKDIDRVEGEVDGCGKNQLCRWIGGLVRR